MLPARGHTLPFYRMTVTLNIVDSYLQQENFVVRILQPEGGAAGRSSSFGIVCSKDVRYG